MPHDEWPEKERAIAFYFVSRQPLSASNIASEVIKMECGTERTAPRCASKVSRLRKTMKETYGVDDPYVKETRRYNLNLADNYLKCLIDMLELEKALGIKDGKLGDKVFEIVKKHNPDVLITAHLLESCANLSW